MMRAPCSEGIRCACQILGARKLESWSWDCQILEAVKLGDAPENLNFWKIYDIIEVAYYRAGAQVIPKCKSKFDKEVKAGRATKI
jgi:hypothetical protein